MALQVVPVTAAVWDDFERLFNGAPSQRACWCVWPMRPYGAFTHADPTNRDTMQSMVEAGEVPGLLAYLDAEAAGWCALGPLSRYPQYDTVGQAANGEGAWGVACIFVAASARGRGVGQRLVAGAKRYAAASGASSLYGPPPWWIAGDAAAVTGATRAFELNGFTRVAPGERMPVLRTPLSDER